MLLFDEASHQDDTDHFIKTPDGNLSGSIAALGAVLPKVTFEAVPADGKVPNFQITAKGADLSEA